MHTAIAWFTRNPVAANLLMIVLLLAGAGAAVTVHQEQFPNIEPGAVVISVPYLGAAPEEAEDGVCTRIEEAIDGAEGIEDMQSTAREGNCNVTVLLYDNVNQISALNEIKSRVDAISTFPAETERAIVSKVTIASSAIQVALHGNTDEKTLKELGIKLRDEIVALDGISQVELSYVRPYEIAIEIPEYNLRRYGLSLSEVANIIKNSSLDMPGGTIYTDGGEVLVRALGQARVGAEFSDVVVLTNPNGTRVLLSDIANIRDDFAEGDLRARFDNQPAVMLKVWRVGKEDIIQMAADVTAFVERYKTSKLPEGLSLSVWSDESKEMTNRLDTVMGTALSGLVLVLVILALFLRFRLAMWVAAGIPIAMAGTLALFPLFDLSISTMSLMGFILVLGILVDDAIVVGERVYGHEQMGKSPVQAAIDGTWEVSIPVIFGVLTTVAAFLPLLLVEGRLNDFFSAISLVVIIALFFSIVESQLILPAHLAHRKHEPAGARPTKGWNRLQDALSSWLTRMAEEVYLPILRFAISWRYATGALALGVLVIAIALIASGRVVFQFFPQISGERAYATLEMPNGIAINETEAAAKQIEAAINALREEFDVQASDGNMIRNTLVSVGTSIGRGGPEFGFAPGRSHFAEVAIVLPPLEERNGLKVETITDAWREAVGLIPDAVSLSFTAATYSAGAAINYELAGGDIDELSRAALDIRSELSRYDGVRDIADTFRAGKQELKIALLPEARNLGLTLADVARQVRAAFYGVEAQRIQRGPDDIRVMVRYPKSERRSIGNLEDMYVRTPTGIEVPFQSVARISLGRGYAAIRRENGQRIVQVTADVDRSLVAPEEVISSFNEEVLPSIRASYPEISISLSGEAEERAKSMIGLARGSALSLVLIYALLAIPLRSYLQPLVIMSVIPFGAVGAIVGHYVMGIELVFFSLLGIVALSGVVVNASLVLVDYINRQRKEGINALEATLKSGVVRFRAIILTSVTTFVGLVPLMSNTDPAVFFVVPMAVSLAFGVLFATFNTLILVPCLYTIAEDVSEYKGHIEHEENPEEFLGVR